MIRTLDGIQLRTTRAGMVLGASDWVSLFRLAICDCDPRLRREPYRDEMGPGIRIWVKGSVGL